MDKQDLNNKIKYIPSEEYFRKNNKNPIKAFILSVLIGYTGIHRMYVGKFISAFVYMFLFTLSIFTKKYMIVWLLIILANIEALNYLIISLKQIDSFLTKDEKMNDNTDEIVENEIGEQEDPSLQKQQLINQSINKNNWINQLYIPVKNEITNIPQVEKEILKFYEQFCNEIDLELKNKGTSLNNIVNIMNETEVYYNNVLYIIYCISEGHIVNHYYNEISINNYLYAHRLLMLIFTELNCEISFKKTVMPIITKIKHTIAPASIDTQFYFHNKSHKEISGSAAHISKQPIENIINMIEKSNLKTWHIPVMQDKIKELFHVIWNHLSETTDNHGWPSSIKLHIDLISTNQFSCYVSKDNYLLLEFLLNEIERKVVSNILNYSINEDNESYQVIKDKMPSTLKKDIEKIINNFTIKISFEEQELILMNNIYYYPNDLQLKIKLISMYPVSVQIYKITQFNSNLKYNDFSKLARYFINDKTTNENVKLFLLYAIDIQENLDNKYAKMLNDIIHSENIDKYNDMKRNKELLSEELFQKLIMLKSKPKKMLDLDLHKIENSKLELTKTIDIIDNFVDQDLPKRKNLLQDLISQGKQETSTENQQEIIDLSPSKKTISLDINKIQTSKNELSSTVDLISNFIDDNYVDEENVIIDQNTNVIEVDKENDKNLSLNNATINVIEYLLANGNIPVNEVTEMARKNGKLLNAFINEINKELYEYTQDQTLIIQDEVLIIDEFYVDIIKEMMNK